MQNKNLDISLNGSILRAIITLSLPILLSNLLQSAYQMVDAFWVGKLWGDAVAAVSISFPVTFLMISLGTGFAIVGSTLIAQYVGAKNFKMVDHVAAQTLMMVVLVSFFLGCVGFLITPWILHLMWVTPSVYHDALTFMRVAFFGLVFVFAFSMFQSIMRGIGQVKMPMYIVGWTVLLNFILDPLFIYGYGIIPASGVAGAAVATLFTQAIAALIGLVILLRWNYGIHLKLSDFAPDFPYIKKAFLLGFPTSIEMSARALGLVVITFLITSFWTLAIASYGAGSNILQLIMIPAMGLSMATSVLVGQNIGAKNIARAEKIAKVSAVVSFSLLTFFGILVYILAPILIGFFIPGDLGVIVWWAHLLRIVALSFGFIGLQLSFSWVFRASGNMTTTLFITLISQWGIQLPLAYIFSKYTSLGIDGIWYGMVISNVVTAGIGMVLFYRGKWKHKKITEEEKFEEKISEESIIEEGIR